ncbi:MAG: hypothetical protein U9Q92_00395 [archaeon]|nr:hypothetical protein [archaeon]
MRVTIEIIGEKYPNLRKKILKRFTVNVNPNIITTLALITSTFAGYYFYKNVLYLAASFVIVNSLLDILKREIEKIYKNPQACSFLDHTFNRLSDTFILIGISLNPLIPVKLGLLALGCVILVSYLGTQAEALTRKRLYRGIVGRTDRHALIVFASFMTYSYIKSLYYGVWIILILSIVTFLQRFWIIHKELKTVK